MKEFNLVPVTTRILSKTVNLKEEKVIIEL